MATELSPETLRRLARLGALRRLEELRHEEAAIRAAFPDLFRTNRSSTGPKPASAGAAGSRQRRRRRRLSPAARTAISERMKKYWVERRKAKTE